MLNALASGHIIGPPGRPESGHPTPVSSHRTVPLSHYHPTHHFTAALLLLSIAEWTELEHQTRVVVFHVMVGSE